MIITVASMKGGVAKTTSAVHIAARLAASHGSTALIDGDQNASATGWAQRGDGKPNKLSFPVISLLLAPRKARDYKNLVIDTKARPDMDELRNLALGCDLLVIPTTPDSLALEGMQLTLQALAQLGATNYRVLLTIVPPPPIAEGELARKALLDARVPLLSPQVRRSIAFQRAAEQGTTVDRLAGRVPTGAMEDYVEVTDELVKIIRLRRKK